MSATGSKAVRLANKASASELESNLSLKNESLDVQCEFILAKYLSVETRQALWDIFERNMYILYVDSSFGWKPHEKKEELFHPLSRFLIMHPEDDPSVIAGYAMFRFEYEDGFDLLYCYELQIQETYQKRGLGRFLMELLIAVGEKWRMHKVMLTVIKANKSAVKFYERTGFNVDPTSPSFGVPPEEDEEDYEILSQSIPISSGDKAVDS